MNKNQSSLNCTDVHEDYINEYVKQGFVKNQFSFFIRCCILSQFANLCKIEIDLYDIYNSIIEKNKISKGACQSYCHGLETRLTALIRERNSVIYCDDHDETCDVSECCDCYEESIAVEWSRDCVRPDNFRKWYSKHFNIIPDCWRFKDGVIQAVEITDTHSVQFGKLEKMAYIDDLLYQNTLSGDDDNLSYIHLDLIEQQSTTGYKFTHNLHYVFNMAFDCPLYPDFKSDDERMRHYYRQGGAGHLYGPDLPEVSISKPYIL